MTWFGFIIRNVRRRPGRAAFTMLGVALAVASFLTLTGLTRGLEQGATASHEERGVDLVVTHRGMWEVFGGSLPESFAESIRRIRGVTDVAAELDTLVHVGEHTRAVVAGWRLDDFTFREMKFLQGRLPQSGEGGVVLGHTLAEATGVKLGSKIRVNFRPFTVVGISSYSNAMLRRMAFLPLPIQQGLLSRPGQVTLFLVRTQSPGNIAEQDRIRSEIAALRPDVTVSTTSEALRSSQIIELIDATSLAISIVALIIGCLSVLNTMAMAVEERTREIGILSALGWSKGPILGLILSEGLLLAGAGGLMGIVLGWIGHSALVAVVSPGAGLSLSALAEQAIRAALVALLLGALGALLPAWRAARLTPAAALRRQ